LELHLLRREERTKIPAKRARRLRMARKMEKAEEKKTDKNLQLPILPGMKNEFSLGESDTATRVYTGYHL